jgi:hypothetical protein
MEILKAIWRHLIKLLILNLILVPFMVLAPAILVVLPLLLILDNPSGDFPGLAQLFFWTGPLSCAFWMLWSCHWQSVRRWQRMGRLDTWRQDHGGLLRTVAKATIYLFAGLFGSFFFKILFLIAFRFLAFEWFDSASRYALWFALFPFSTFAPVILLWLARWLRGRRDQLRSSTVYEAQ